MTETNDAWEKTMRTYESLAEKSSAMLEAARRSDWDAVIEIEQECARLIAELKADGDLVPLDDGARRRKAQLIRRMLIQDAEIRDLAQPWLAELGRLLSVGRNRRNVETAYG